MSVGERLKQARNLKGISQGVLAEKIGVSRGVIANIEYDRTQPQKIVISAICEALDIREKWLLTGEGEINADQQVLEEIARCAAQLNEAEQNYILDMIKTFERHRGELAGRKQT